VFWKNKKSACEACPERTTSCLAGHCVIRSCNLCVWQVDVGWLKGFVSATNRYRCRAPGRMDLVTGKAVDSCESTRNYSHLCDRSGKWFKHKDICPGGGTVDTQG
jgi:hypothetical protein